MHFYQRLMGDFVDQVTVGGIVTMEVDPARELLSVHGLGKFRFLYFLVLDTYIGIFRAMGKIY